MRGSRATSGAHNEQLEQRLTNLQDEKQRLSEQVKRLLKTEHERFHFQEQLDNQVRIYRHLYEIGKKLNATFDLNEILQIATHFVLYQLNFERCVAFLYDPETDVFCVRALDGYYDDTSRALVADVRLSAGDAALAPVLAGSEQVLCAEGCEQPDLLHLGRVLKMAEYVALPFGGDKVQQPIGLLIAGNTAENREYHTRAEADSDFGIGLANLVSQVATTIHMRREIQAREQELQRSRERLVTASEEERRRLRRDLHDGVGPQLAALMLELETASDLLSDDPEASALMAKLSERAREIVSDVRRSVHALRPPALDELGLIGALKEGEAQYSRRGLRISVTAPHELPPLPAAVEVACYRIAQEAMTNVVRHAEASTCWVRIGLDEELLKVEVEDDGRGIGEEDRAGVGMSSMRERAEQLGGKCSVGPSTGGGTLVSARLPCRSASNTERGEG